MTTSHEYQKVQAKKRPALCLSSHTFLNHCVLSVFNIFVLAIFVLGPLLAWFAAIDTVDKSQHSMCSYRNRVTNRPEDQTPVFPDFDHVAGLNGTSTSVIGHQIPLKDIFSQFYTVNMVFGNYSLTIVKVIDIVWDIIVGWGGQALLLYVLSQVFYEVRRHGRIFALGAVFPDGNERHDGVYCPEHAVC